MLSKQPHYEFGLRSVKSVIQLSVTMKATTMTTSKEDAIVFNAVHRMKFSELLPEDQTLFLRYENSDKDKERVLTRIASDIFPEVEVENPVYER